MLEDKIMEEYKKAMKEKDSLKVSVLSFLRAELKYVAIDKRQDKLDDVDAIAAVKKQIKQHQDSIEQFKTGNRQDLVEKEEKELEVLKSFLPEQMPLEKIKGFLEEVVLVVGAKGPQDMGKVMKELMPKLAGNADNKLVSELVKQRLNPPPLPQ